MRRIRGAIGMGITWAIGWAVAGVMIGVASMLFPGLPWNTFFKFFDAPLPALAVPGFFAGALFSIVLGVVGRRRRFDELSLPKFTAWGAAGGALLSLVPATMVGLGLATLRADLNIWAVTVVIAPPLTALSAVSAAVSLMIARRAERRQTRHYDDEGTTAAMPDGRTPELLDGRATSFRSPSGVFHKERRPGSS
jgi:hypothetical protein